MDISDWISKIDAFIWGIPLMVLLVGTGVYLTIRMGLVQFRCFKHAIDIIRGKYDDPDDPGEITHFQALCSALSAAIAHGAAKTDEPVREGLVAMIGPFVDTILICSITAIAIIITGAHEICQDKSELTSKAFEVGLGTAWGGKFVLTAMVFFAFSTLITWSYYGDRAADFLLGKKGVRPYRWIYLGFIILGACVTIDVVIDFCDAMNGLMAIPNLIALVVLSGKVSAMTKDYTARRQKQE